MFLEWNPNLPASLFPHPALATRTFVYEGQHLQEA